MIHIQFFHYFLHVLYFYISLLVSDEVGREKKGIILKLNLI